MSDPVLSNCLCGGRVIYEPVHYRGTSPAYMQVPDWICRCESCRKQSRQEVGNVWHSEQGLVNTEVVAKDYLARVWNKQNSKS